MIQHDMNDHDERLYRFQIERETDVAKVNALAQLRMKIKDPDNRAWHIPDPFFFHPMLVPEWRNADKSTLLHDNCVRGFWGTSPLMLVGSRPTEKGIIN